MLYITLASLIAPLLIWLVFLIKFPTKNKVFPRSTNATTTVTINKKFVTLLGLAVMVAMIVFKSIITYFSLSSRNTLSILGSNLIWGAIMLAIMVSLTFNTTSRSTTMKTQTRIGGAILVVILILVGFGEAHSSLSVKPVAKSIKSEKIDSNSAPTFKKGVTPVAISPKTVKNRMNKNMSDVPNSQYFRLGDIQAQYYKGKPVYIAPVEFDGFFKYYSAHQTVPGYFIIDATSVNAEPHFVKKNIKYTNTSYFNRNAARRIYSQHPTWLAANGSQPQLEVDDNGTPYYVQTTYKSMALSHRINYSRLHVVVVNAETGKTNLYTLNHLPRWIDEGITTEVADSMNEAYGKYQRGFLNMYLSKTGIQLPTSDSVISTFDKQGNVQYFTDFTNPRSDADSALGYSMINARTGKLVYYKTHGIMDSDGAKANANNNYKAQQWKSSMPVIYNINGKPTWVLSILDNTNAFRGYYYIDASDQSVHATGDSANEAVENFRQALIDNGSNAGNTSQGKKQKISGKIDRAVITAKGSSQVLLFTLQGSNTIYTVDGEDYQKALLTRAGDEVKATAQVKNGKSVGNVTDFSNSNLK
ncbi:hypothetical protein LOOC260_105990 [Paucilactobacillus hokkaidonensis JCM 18461]|uniref:Uncharacterized protein n=2 Tax=Paucilactobacillus hokkaidonensis TaxID=1193095 RepID=A0A0A1GXI6_9LACO|nr:hypothetical protein [Paucilactobacillus hokkaidonensis]KRO11294.1 hypothetical protein IV59_GL000032 [Paucilactobacillus hokkaidonensis]BAP85156.1 hypothetical protein LOOC260_105990 [Paucilactobacillus hokkaidonensis JCM 18461]